LDLSFSRSVIDARRREMRGYGIADGRGLGLLVLITCAVAISFQFSVKIVFS
jgi:hypothetical protein